MTAAGPVIAVDVGGTTIKGALVESAGTVVARRTLGTFAVGDDALLGILSVIESLRADVDDGEPASIGIAVPGLVDRGAIAFAANLRFADVDLQDIVAARFGVPVTVEHDARAALAAELLVARESRSLLDDMVFVPIGTGVSAAILSEGRVVRGSRGGAGEFGHQIVVDDGDACGCGQRGCLEVYASATALVRRYRRTGPADIGSAEELVDLLESDPVARAVWGDAVTALATGVTGLTAVLDPTLIVIGGGLSLAGERLLAPLRSAVRQSLTWRPVPEIAVSEIGPDAGIIGAACVAVAGRVDADYVRTVGASLAARAAQAAPHQ